MKQAAPNRAQIRARCLEAGPLVRLPEEMVHRPAVGSGRGAYGGQFLRVGEDVRAIAFDLTSAPRPGDMVSAEAEYLGGPHQGVVQLYDLKTS